MIRPWFFLLIAGGLIAAIVALSGRIPEGDPFAAANDERQVIFDNSWALAVGKERHILAQPTYDVGLFGNSRSLDVSDKDMELAEGCRFFNYSLSGESLRASVALLERLAGQKKAPRLAIVSVDNFELQLYSNPDFLDALPRWRSAFGDLKAGILRSDISLRQLARMVWRVANTEIALAKRPFNAELFREGFNLTFGRGATTFETTTTLGRGYRSDGSRSQKPIDGTEPPKPLVSSNSRQVLPGYLAYDLERLRHLNAAGLKVILYESPISPRNADIITHPGPIAAETRATYLAACRALGLSCYSAPAQLPGDDGNWRDSNHPPAQSLGRYIGQIRAGQPDSCRA